MHFLDRLNQFDSKSFNVLTVSGVINTLNRFQLWEVRTFVIFRRFVLKFTLGKAIMIRPQYWKQSWQRDIDFCNDEFSFKLKHFDRYFSFQYVSIAHTFSTFLIKLTRVTYGVYHYVFANSNSYSALRVQCNLS